ncbi:MAG: hypothetical protein PHX71_10130 [Synergistales bacterium]|nr:hypothetical protein [Synergistales bacterium]
MILAFSLSMLFLFDIDFKSSTWLLEGAAPGGPVHRPARRSIARRRDDELFSWWWAISSELSTVQAGSVISRIDP